MRVSPHFQLSEFACHDGTPVPRHAIADVRELCTVFLEPLRHRFGPTVVVSGYRTRRYNKSVGGAPQSMHIYEASRLGAAADVACKTGNAAEWYSFLSSLDPPGLGSYSAHVHVDTRRGHARW